jgi:cysteine desulfurase family protein
VIYFNQAATSHPKPESVYQAVDQCLRGQCGKTSRSNASYDADRVVYQTREVLARLFNITHAERIIFTANATEALNLAVFGLLDSGDHVVTTSMEHNAVTRPLHYLQTYQNVTVTKVPCSSAGELDPQDILRAIQQKTKLIAITHTSNVTGTLIPIEGIGEIARERGIYFLVDAAQSAGCVRIDVKKTGIDLLAFPGHKGLFGPPGTGGLYIAEGIELRPLKYGGTGSHSDLDTMPDVVPDRFESGTSNLPAIAGLNAGLEFILQKNIDEIRHHEMELTQRFINKVIELDGVTVYGSLESWYRVATVAINIENCDPMELGHALQEIYGIICRTGLHCAPDAHKTIGTFPYGCVRFSFGYFNTTAEVETLIAALSQITQMKSKRKQAGSLIKYLDFADPIST